MIVLDASALVELLLGTPRGREVAERVADPAIGLHIPHLADVEIAQVLRRYVRGGELDPTAAAAALDDLRSLDLERHAHEPLLDRVWARRGNLSTSDAVYVALAEALDATLLTCDARLAKAPRPPARIEVVKPAGGAHRFRERRFGDRMRVGQGRSARS